MLQKVLILRPECARDPEACRGAAVAWPGVQAKGPPGEKYGGPGIHARLRCSVRAHIAS